MKMKNVLGSVILVQLLVAPATFAGMSVGSDLNTSTIAPPTAPMSPGAPMQSSPVTASPTQLAPVPVNTGGEWKQTNLPPLYHFGAMSGLGVIDSYGGFALLGTASMTVIDHGFIPEVSDSVAAEIELGPVFTSAHTAFWYSMHMRWDFRKDSDWTFYALAGLAGNDTPESLGGHFEIWPRVGLGTIWKVSSSVSMRAELSHEFTGLGVVFPL
jgi:hypothetical protein